MTYTDELAEEVVKGKITFMVAMRKYREAKKNDKSLDRLRRMLDE